MALLECITAALQRTAADLIITYCKSYCDKYYLYTLFDFTASPDSRRLNPPLGLHTVLRKVTKASITILRFDCDTTTIRLVDYDEKSEAGARDAS